ncbi:MAG: hypothetical protein IKM84_04565 [Oscillospiraceae bacterium]|nr:hypothetical protein [Oscillospiraceae bacterium]
MISPTAYGDAIEALLNVKFPNEKVYRDFVPEDFARPSHEILVTGWTVTPASIDDISMDLTILIRSFVPVDDYHMSDYSALYRQAMGVMGIFAPGYIHVSDPDTGARRAPKVKALGCPVVGADYSEVTATLSMQLCREDFAVAAAAAPPMADAVRINASYTS